MDSLIEKTYLEVSHVYNSTPLATEHGWTHVPSDYELVELSKLAEYLSVNCQVLDIGTGMGIAPRLAKAVGARVVSFDSLSAAGETAIENIREAGIQGQFVDILEDTFPLDNESVDVVYSEM